jgi:hypothetical protein
VTGYPKKRKFLSIEDLNAAAGAIFRTAKRQGIKVAAVGGYACQLYGSPRLTVDLDVIASDGPIKGLLVGKALTFGGYQTKALGVPIDVILRDDDYEKLYFDALRTAVKDTVAGIFVVRPEYLAAMKLAAARGKDDLDLKFLIVNVVDVVKTRAVIKKQLGSYAADEFDRVVDEALWEAKRGR